MRLSLCITTMNRYLYTIESFMNVIDDERISEIIISDDRSTDNSYLNLKDYFKDKPKVKLFQNEKNVGMSVNKKIAIGYATNEFAIIFDSDNKLSKKYLDALEEVVELNNETIYLPIGALPKFDFSAYSGLTIDRNNVKDYMDQPMFRVALNTCNCLVNRDFYLSVFKEDKAIGCADTINHIFNHLKAGGKLYFVPNLTYSHLIHKNSAYLQDINYNMKKSEEVANLIRML